MTLSTTNAASPLAPDDDEETLWALLLSDIERGWIVPVVGRDLLTATILDESGQPVERSYYGLIARELASKLKLPTDLVSIDGPNPLGAVAAEYLARGNDPNRLYRPVRLAVDAVNATRIQEFPAALLKLGEIETFRVFVTTTFDSLLEDSLRASRGVVPARMVFSPGAVTPLTDFAVGESRERTVAILRERADPIVVHILGRMSDNPDFVVTEEDAFEFVYQLQEVPPKSLIDLLSQMKLLFIGCRFPSWLVRFFLRTARRQRLLRAAVDRTDFVVDADAADDTALVEFLRKFQTQTEIFGRYRPAQFVDELHRRYLLRRAERGDSRPQWMTRCSIFISYASEDAAVAKSIADQLRKLEFPVWLDRMRLAPGDDWARKIRPNIEGAAAFVPLMSRAAAEAEGSREFRKEWDVAIDVLRGMAENAPFVFPLAIDTISPSADGVRQELRALNWTPLPENGVLPDTLVAELSRARRRCQMRGVR